MAKAAQIIEQNPLYETRAGSVAAVDSVAVCGPAMEAVGGGFSEKFEDTIVQLTVQMKIGVEDWSRR